MSFISIKLAFLPAIKLRFLEERKMKIEIIRREIIKPSTPTPNDFKKFNLSLLNQLAPPVYTSLLLFYPRNNNDHLTTYQIHQQLKKSVSKTLTRFFPLAGRIESSFSIECHDYGAHYTEARIHYTTLFSFLQQPLDLEKIQLFLPIESNSPKAVSMPLLLVQLTSFECGGVALGMCMSHKLADAAMMFMFVRDWAAITLGNPPEQLPVINFNAASYFPVKDPASFQLPALIFKRAKCVTKRYLFDAKKIASLKAKASSVSVQKPTRTEAITALIWRCAMNASSRLNKGVAKHSVMHHFVNLRRIVEPPISGNTLGSLVLYFSTHADQSKIELQDLVAEFRKGMKEFRGREAKRIGGDEAVKVVYEKRKERRELMNKDDTNLFSCTSLCSFNFYEHADFGLGKPIWMTVDSGASLNNNIILSNMREGYGVEAWVTLSEKEMAIFEADPELLSFASSNPSVLVLMDNNQHHHSSLSRL